MHGNAKMYIMLIESTFYCLQFGMEMAGTCGCSIKFVREFTLPYVYTELSVAFRDFSVATFGDRKGFCAQKVVLAAVFQVLWLLI